MKSKFLLATLGVTFLFNYAFCQHHAWVHIHDDTSINYITNIGLDYSDNVYVGAEFQDSADLDPGPAKLMFYGAGFGNLEGCLQKLNKDGDLVWAVVWHNDTVPAQDLSFVFDKLNNIIVYGRFFGTYDFDPSPTSAAYLTADTLSDGFILKLDSAGQFQWVKQIRSSALVVLYDVELDSASNIYVCGSFSGIADFNPDTTNFFVPSSAGGDAFVAKYDANMNLQWVYNYGSNALWGNGPTQEYALRIDIKSNQQPVLLGRFGGTIDFDPSTANWFLTSQGGAGSTVLVNLYDDGTFRWAKIVGSLNSQYTTMELDNNDNIILSGNFSGTLDFDPGIGVHLLTVYGPYNWITDCFVQKLDTSGGFMWAKTMGGNLWDGGWDIGIDSLNNIYVQGLFEQTAYFGTSHSLTSSINRVFLLKMDANGTYIWVEDFGGFEYNNIALTPGGDVYHHNRFFGKIDFDPGSDSIIYVVPQGENYWYVQKLQCPNSVKFEFIGCDSVTDLYGKMHYNSVLIRDTLLNQYGCDSLISQDITVYPSLGNFTISGKDSVRVDTAYRYTSSPFDSSYMYAWTAINGHIDSVFLNMVWVTWMDSLSGKLLLTVQDSNGCTNAIDSLTINILSGIGLMELIASQILLYPNPTTDFIKIESSLPIKQIRVLDEIGTTVYEASDIIDIFLIVSFANFHSGIYFLELQHEDKTIISKVIKL